MTLVEFVRLSWPVCASQATDSCADNFCLKSMTLSYDGSSEPGWGQEHRVQSCSEAIGRRWLSFKGAADPCVHSMPHSKYMYAVRCPHNMNPKKRVETKKGPNPLIVENGRPSGWDRISYRALNTKSVRVDLPDNLTEQCPRGC